MKAFCVAFTGLLVSLPTLGAEVARKDLKVGEYTLEGIGEIKDGDPFTALRRIHCVEMDFSQVPAESAPLISNGLEIREALVLNPGSRVILRRAAINEYNKALNSTVDSVIITCER